MKNIALVILAVFLTTFIYSQSTAGWFDPKNYEDCVLKNMKGVESDRAAVIVAKACRKKFPEKVSYLTDEEAFGSSVTVEQPPKQRLDSLLPGKWVCQYTSGAYSGQAYTKTYNTDHTITSQSGNGDNKSHWEILTNGDLMEDSGLSTRQNTLWWLSEDEFTTGNNIKCTRMSGSSKSKATIKNTPATRKLVASTQPKHSPVQSQPSSSAQEEFDSIILKTHQDYYEIVSTAKFWDWFNSQSEGIRKVQSSGDAKLVAGIITMYKEKVLHRR